MQISVVKFGFQIILAMLALFATALRAATVDAPYQIDAVATESITVDFGANGPQSIRDQLQQMTVIGNEGAEWVALEGFEKKCVYLCGEPVPGQKPDGAYFSPTCHYVGHFKRIESKHIGGPLVALAGKIPLSGVRSIPGAGTETAIIAVEWVSADYKEALGGFRSSYRWFNDEASNEGYLESRYSGRDFYVPPIKLSSCTLRALPPFARMECSDFAELLYDARSRVQGLADNKPRGI